jgi:hypothetical protein
MRAVQASNQGVLSSASRAWPVAAVQPMRRMRSITSSSGLWCWVFSHSANGVAGAQSANTWKQRSCASIRCSQCCWRAAWLRPLPKAAAPVARSWPASSLPCMKWNMATSRREMPGSVALSAASKTTASRPAIRRI